MEITKWSVKRGRSKKWPFFVPDSIWYTGHIKFVSSFVHGRWPLRHGEGSGRILLASCLRFLTLTEDISSIQLPKTVDDELYNKKIELSYYGGWKNDKPCQCKACDKSWQIRLTVQKEPK